MDAILHALGGILLRAVPTFLLVIVLHFFLKYFFFKPFDQVMRRRYEATEGARKLAEKSLALASAKTADYESAMRAAKAEVYETQEKLHKQLQEQQAAELLKARQQAEEVLKSAKADLSRDVDAAKAGLAQESDRLANEIVDSLLRRTVA